MVAKKDTDPLAPENAHLAHGNQSSDGKGMTRSNMTPSLAPTVTLRSPDHHSSAGTTTTTSTGANGATNELDGFQKNTANDEKADEALLVERPICWE